MNLHWWLILLTKRTEHLCLLHYYICHSIDFLFFFLIYLFLERKEGKEKVRERNINVWLPLVHTLLGTWPSTQACALTENQTGHPLVCSPHSIHWATPARLVPVIFNEVLYIYRAEESVEQFLNIPRNGLFVHTDFRM